MCMFNIILSLNNLFFLQRDQYVPTSGEAQHGWRVSSKEGHLIAD